MDEVGFVHGGRLHDVAVADVAPLLIGPSGSAVMGPGLTESSGGAVRVDEAHIVDEVGVVRGSRLHDVAVADVAPLLTGPSGSAVMVPGTVGLQRW